MPSCSNREDVEEDVEALDVLCEPDVLIEGFELEGMDVLAEQSTSKVLTEFDELLALEILITLEELEMLRVLCLATSFDSLSTLSASNASISLSSLTIG